MSVLWPQVVQGTSHYYCFEVSSKNVKFFLIASLENCYSGKESALNLRQQKCTLLYILQPQDKLLKEQGMKKIDPLRSLFEPPNVFGIIKSVFINDIWSFIHINDHQPLLQWKKKYIEGVLEQIIMTMTTVGSYRLKMIIPDHRSKLNFWVLHCPWKSLASDRGLY